MESELADRVRSHDVDALAEYLGQVRRPLMAFVERRLGQALRSVEFGDRDPFSWLCHITERLGKSDVAIRWLREWLRPAVYSQADAAAGPAVSGRLS